MTIHLLHRAALAWFIALWGTAALGQAPAADIGAGKKRAAACFACHGADGVSKIPGTPHLAGQRRDYLEAALRAYREGSKRQDPTMTAMAKPLTDPDIANIAAYFSLLARAANGQTAAQILESQARIQPVGQVQVAAAPAAAAAPRTGQAVYAESCVACHGSGAAGAPKAGDKAAWAPRLAQGKDTLAQHALQGFKAMPAKGGCASCSDDEVRAAVEHLIASSR